MKRRWVLGLGLALLVGLLACAWWVLRDEEPALPEPTAAPAASPGEPQREVANEAPVESPARSAAPKTSPEKGPATQQRRRMTPAQHRARLMKIMRKLQAASEAPMATGGASGGEPETVPKLTARYIKASIKEVVPLIKECYENALRKDPKIGGKMVVTFEIVGDADLGGLVSTSAIDPKRSNITAPGLRECVRETIYALELPRPESGGKTRVSYPFRFRARGQAAPAAPAKKAP